MIVLDASIGVEILLGSTIGSRAIEHLEWHREVHVPEHFHIEVLSVLRKYSLSGELREPRTTQTLALLQDLRATSHSNLKLLPSIWELRTTLTSYDAAYLALARYTDGSLLTLDRGLAAAAQSESRLVKI